MTTAFPELSGYIAADRASEAAATGAELIVSACPSCEGNLTPDARKAKMKVYDLNVLVAEAMGIKL